MGGSTGVSGPPVIAYWLGSLANAANLRDNIMAYYALSSSSTDVAYFIQGLFTWHIAAYALLGWPAYAGGLWAGARLFRGSTDRGFRIAAYVLIAFAVVAQPAAVGRAQGAVNERPKRHYGAAAKSGTALITPPAAAMV